MRALTTAGCILGAVAVPAALLPAFACTTETKLEADAGPDASVDKPAASLECGPPGPKGAASCHNYTICGDEPVSSTVPCITHCYDQEHLSEYLNVDACDWGGGMLMVGCSCPREQALGGCQRIAKPTFDAGPYEEVPVVDWYYEGEDYGGMTVDDMRASCEHPAVGGTWISP